GARQGMKLLMEVKAQLRRLLVGMAYGARQGLKQASVSLGHFHQCGRNGLWSPSGIETIFPDCPQFSHLHQVGMAYGARQGLKRFHMLLQVAILRVGMAYGARQGLKHAFSISPSDNLLVGMAYGARQGLKLPFPNVGKPWL